MPLKSSKWNHFERGWLKYRDKLLHTWIHPEADTVSNRSIFEILTNLQSTKAICHSTLGVVLGLFRFPLLDFLDCYILAYDWPFTMWFATFSGNATPCISRSVTLFIPVTQASNGTKQTYQPAQKNATGHATKMSTRNHKMDHRIRILREGRRKQMWSLLSAQENNNNKKNKEKKNGIVSTITDGSIQVSVNGPTLPSLRSYSNPKPAPTQTLGLREGRVGRPQKAGHRPSSTERRSNLTLLRTPDL